MLRTEDLHWCLLLAHVSLMAQSFFEGLFVVKVSTFQLEQPATAVGLILDDALSCQICLAAVCCLGKRSGLRDNS